MSCDEKLPVKRRRTCLEIVVVDVKKGVKYCEQICQFYKALTVDVKVVRMVRGDIYALSN